MMNYNKRVPVVIYEETQEITDLLIDCVKVLKYEDLSKRKSMIEGYILMGKLNLELCEMGIEEDEYDYKKYEYYLVECDEL